MCVLCLVGTFLYQGQQPTSSACWYAHTKKNVAATVTVVRIYGKITKSP